MVFADELADVLSWDTLGLAVDADGQVVVAALTDHKRAKSLGRRAVLKDDVAGLGKRGSFGCGFSQLFFHGGKIS
jgi:hypothetical protein